MKYRTDKCKSVGQAEVEFDVDARVPDVDAKWLVTSIESEVLSGTRFKPGDIFQIGWMITKFDDHGANLVLVEPDMREIPIVWENGVTQTLIQYRIQCDTAASLGVPNDFPSIRESALIGDDLYLAEYDFILERLPSDDDSGWFVGNLATQLDYTDPNNLKRISLYELAVRIPQVVMFLGLPPGIRVEFSRTSLGITFNAEPRRPLMNSFLESFCERNAVRIKA